MKAIIICCIIILVSGSVFFYFNKEQKDRINKRDSNAKLEKLKDDMNEITRHTEWLKKNLDFELELRSLLRKGGFTLEKANDSLIADQDRLYIYGDLKDSEQAEWYKEHRKDLLKFPSEYYKQFPKDK
jgi:hypothetical protein